MADTHEFDASKLYDVSHFVAVITGGGSGIGLMAAQALSANGAKVYITGRRVDVLETAAKTHKPSRGKGEIIPLGPCDVTSKEDLDKLVQQISSRESHINLVMCNAGVSGAKGDTAPSDAVELKKNLWENESVEDWQDTYKTDVTSVYFTAVAFLPLLQATIKPKGSLEKFAPSIIITSSMSGMIRHAQNHMSYNAAKAGAVHLTKMMSAELQDTGIRVNSIAPGYFPSEMTAKESDEKQKSELPKEKIEEKGHVPLMRAGRETEMGMTVLFLAKNEYVNGVVLPVDGGVMNVLGS